jgi:hypothetical protein
MRTSDESTKLRKSWKSKLELKAVANPHQLYGSSGRERMRF